MPESNLGYRILIIVFIVAVNAFFAAAEVSLVSCRRFRLVALAEQGNLGAQAALSLLARPERLLSVTQVGVTLASLALGWVGEDTFHFMVLGLLGPLISPANSVVIHGISLGIAFLLMSFIHIVIGEVVPKNLGIERADQLAIVSAPALLLFYKVSLPFVYVIERSASACSRLLGLKGHQHGGGHSAEELQLLVSSSRSAGHLLDFEESAIQRVLSLGDFFAREAMVPRNGVVSISVDATLDDTLQLLNEHQHSRYPIYEGTPENIIGFLLAKDLLHEWDERRHDTARRRRALPFQVRRLLRKPVVVPETKPLSELLDAFRKSHVHMGVVVDEFGTVAGIITLEDVLEQIFGEIEDEYDARPAEPVSEARVIEFGGTTSIRDLETRYGIELPGDAGFETLAGFLLFHLEHVPVVNEQVEHAGMRFTVLEMDKNRIAKVKAERL